MIFQGYSGGSGSGGGGGDPWGTTYPTVVTAEGAVGNDNDLIYVVETATFYRFELMAAAYTADSTYVLNTSAGGDTRWLGIAGRYIVDTSFVLGETTITAGLKDLDVTTAVKLGDALNTTLDTTNKTLLGSTNELKARIDLLEGIGAYTTYTDPALDTITQADIADYLGAVITLTAAGNSQTLPTPAVVATYHEFTVINNDTSTDSIAIVGAGTITLAPGKKVKFIWDGDAWIASDASGLWFDDGTSLSPQATRAVGADAVVLSTTPSTTSTEGLLSWNSTKKTLDIDSGTGPVIQVGFEAIGTIYNNTGSQINNGQVIFGVPLTGGGAVEGRLANASTVSKLSRVIAVATENIPNGSTGRVTTRGRVRGIDTSAFSVNDPVYISTTVDGGLETPRPEFPNYDIFIGLVIVSDAVDGEIDVHLAGYPEDTIQDAWDGCFREKIKFTVSSDGTTITGNLQNEDGVSDLTTIFSDGLKSFDVTPAATVTLTAGSDTNPQTNYVYVDQATRTLQASTSSFPYTIEHIKVAEVAVQSAATTKTLGALRNQNWNDEVKDVNDNGHLQHITERLRRENSKWESGVAGTATLANAGADVYFGVTSGIVYQLHRQNFPVINTIPYTVDGVNQGTKTFTIADDGDLSSTFPDGRLIKIQGSTGNDGVYTIVSTSYSAPNFDIVVSETIPDATVDGTIGDNMFAVNDFTTAYNSIQSFSDITTDASGNALNNTSFSVVVWGTANKSGQVCQLMANYPTSTYSKNDPDVAVQDPNNYSVYSIPKTFQGVGFLIARVTLVNNGGTYTIYDTEDLRGSVPNTTAGGGAGGTGVTEFTALNDTPSTYTTFGEQVLRVNATENAVEFVDLNVGGTLSNVAYLDQPNTFIGTQTAPTFIGDLTGNADTATALETTRTIAGTGFDGTANIDIDHNDLANIQLTASGVTYGHIDDQAQTIAGAKTFIDGIASPTVNATTALQLSGTDINTGGTLSNVAYLDQANSFSATGNSFNGGVRVGSVGAVAAGYAIDARDDMRIVGSDGNQIIDFNELSASNKFRLQVGGTGHTTDTIQLGRDDGNNDVYVPGKVGIGTNSPSHLLEVAATDGGGISLGDRYTSGNIYIGREGVGAFGGNSGWINFGNLDDDNFLAFGTLENGVGGGERMRIAPSGNVGIGTTSPITPLHIKAITPSIRFEDMNDFQEWTVRGGQVFIIRDETNSVERIRIDSSGNLGVGTSSPLYKLDTDAGTAVTTARFLSDSSDAAIIRLYNEEPNNQWSWGVAGTSNAHTAAGHMYFYDETNSRKVMDLSTAGDAYFVGDVSAASFTDRTEILDDIQEAIKAVKTIVPLPPKEYDPNDQSKQLDHAKLHPFLQGKGKEPSRNMTASISCLAQGEQYLFDERERMIDKINELCKALEMKQLPKEKKVGFFKRVFGKKK